MEWRYCSEDWKSISLHDNFISGMRFEDDVTIEFEDGFDVCAENPQNGTGRHKHTGKAAVALENGRFLEGTLFISKTEEKPLSEEDIAALELEVLDFKRFPDSVFLACDAWRTAYGDCYCELEYACSSVEFRWNEFTDDAWFQDFGKK